MDQVGTAESRRGTRTRVAQEDEGQRSSDGARASPAAPERGPAQRRWSRGKGAPCRRLQCGHGDLRVSLYHV